MKRKVLLSGLFAALLAISACGAPAAAPAETPMADEAVTETEAMTETESMEETDAMTETESMDDSEAMTETEGMEDSEAMTETESMDDSEAMTETEGMDDSEAMTEAMTTEGTVFHVRIENISGESITPTPFSPGTWVLHSDPAPIFIAGQPDRGEGLEAQAEDGNPMNFDASLEAAGATHGLFTMPVGSSEMMPATPGNAFEFVITATVDMPNLTIASMFGQSNDLFIAPNENGIALFDANGQPITGNITDQFMLWDAGVEMNEEPLQGSNQAPRQPAPNIGPADEDNMVRLVNDGYSYATVPELVVVTVEAEGMD